MSCKRQLGELQRSKKLLDESGVQIFAISTDHLDGPMTMVANDSIEFPILYTSLDDSVPHLFGVFDLFGDGLAAASVFLIDIQGDIVWQSIGENSTHQVSAKKIIEQVELLK